MKYSCEAKLYLIKKYIQDNVACTLEVLATTDDEYLTETGKHLKNILRIIDREEQTQFYRREKRDDVNTEWYQLCRQ